MNRVLLGFGAAAAAALIGAGWQVVTRFGVTGTVTAYDLALIRYVIPALLLFPILWRAGFVPRTTHPLLFLTILTGGGLPFGLLVMQAAKFAPVSHIAVLIPATMPIFVAGLAAIFLSEAITPPKALGFAFMACGVGCIGWEAVASMGPQTVYGDLLLVLAAFLWGIYSVAFRRSGIDPWHGAALICFWSALLVIPVWAIQHDGGLWRAPPAHLAVQVLWQGVLAGAIGMWVYGYAMRQIGAARAASLGALVPALAAFGGWLVLSEVPSPLALVGITVTAVGVGLASRPGLPRWAA